MFTVRVAPVRLCSCSGENISLESPLPKWQRLCVNGGKRASELFLERASISDLSSTRSPPQPNPTRSQSKHKLELLISCINYKNSQHLKMLPNPLVFKMTPKKHLPQHPKNGSQMLVTGIIPFLRLPNPYTFNIPSASKNLSLLRLSE